MVSYQALFRLSVYKIPAIYLSGAKNVCFCTIRDFGSPTNSFGPNVYTLAFCVYVATYLPTNKKVDDQTIRFYKVNINKSSVGPISLMIRTKTKVSGSVVLETKFLTMFGHVTWILKSY